MVRTLAQFPDSATASAAIRAALSGGFDADSLRMYAIGPDGARTGIPIGVRSHSPLGFALGALIAAPAGVYLALQYHGSIVGGLLFASGTGAMLGATMGLGSWTVGPERRRVPSDAQAFIVAIDGPEGRAKTAHALLMNAGGSDASPQSI